MFIYLAPYASENDLISAIDKEWDAIKYHFEEIRKKDKGIRELSHLRTHGKKDRDRIIYNLYQKSRSELGLKRGEFKEILIARILKKGARDRNPARECKDNCDETEENETR